MFQFQLPLLPILLMVLALCDGVVTPLGIIAWWGHGQIVSVGVVCGLSEEKWPVAY
jgi:hypothetical protein